MTIFAMQFNSLTFLLFLSTVFLLYWQVFKGRRQQNLLLLSASYVFYGWWDWRFLSLIALTSLLSRKRLFHPHPNLSQTQKPFRSKTRD